MSEALNPETPAASASTQNLGLLADGARDTSRRRAGFCHTFFAGIERDIDEVPAGGLLALVADIVGPTGEVGERRKGAGGAKPAKRGVVDRALQQLCGFGPGVGIQLIERDQGDDPVARAAPRESRRNERQTRDKCKKAKQFWNTRDCYNHGET